MNKFALFGCITLILGGLGHLIIVDVAALQFEFAFVKWLPVSPLEQLTRTTIDFEPLGATNAFRAFSGFSVWVALSLMFIGAQGLFIYKFAEKGHLLRTLTWSTYFLVSIVFTCIAMTCFIWPAAVAGALACILFSLAVIKERKLH
jgi:hypothetical protein